MTIKALFIEVLGTLLDVNNIEKHIAELVIKEIPVRISGADLVRELVDEMRNRFLSEQYRSMKHLVKDSLAAITKKYSVILSPHELYYIANKAVNALVGIMRPYGDAQHFLKEVRGMGLAMYVLTSLDNDIAKKILITLSLAEYFNGIVSADLSRAMKPSPKIYLSALRRAGVRPEESLIVSALPEDVVGGTLCNIRTIFVKRGNDIPMGAQKVAGNLVEVVEILRKLVD